MKSLLNLLEHEDDIVKEIERYEWDISWYKRELRRVEEYRIECEAKDYDIARFKEFIDAATQAIEDAKIERKRAQQDIRRYFEEFINIETEDI